MALLGPALVSVNVKVIVPPTLAGLDAVLTMLKSVCGTGTGVTVDELLPVVGSTSFPEIHCNLRVLVTLF